MKTPELLLPAGSLQKAKFAFAFGADAVYAGVPVFSLRTKENEFNLNQIKEIIEFAHNKGKKVYVTTNIYPHNDKLESFFTAINQMVELRPDAFIVSDPGVINYLRKKHPQVEIHLSVQQNNVNWASAEFWGEQGVKRIILARELSLDEIKTIVQKNPSMEFEAFVHGEICIAYSGRCLLSNYMAGRDANQGACAQSCRWQYKVLEENLRPGQYHDAYEDANGTYIMNSRDLCGIEYLKELQEAGVCSFKIAGRNKGINYVAIVAKTYRQAIDQIQRGETPNYKVLIKELQSVGNRGFIPGFLLGRPEEQGQRYEANTMLQTHVFAGVLTAFDKETNTATFLAKNKIDVGDTLELITPTQKLSHTITEMQDNSGKSIQSIHPGAGEFSIVLKEPLNSEFCVARRFGEQKKMMSSKEK